MTNEMSYTDRELLAAAAAGDHRYFTVIFDRHAKAVYNHCFRLTGSWSAAEDATQEAFVVAWRKRQQLQLTGDSVLPWLLSVATNTVFNEWRSAKRWLAALARLPQARDTAVDNTAEVIDRLDDQRRMGEVLKLLARLPKAEREALTLCVWSEVPYADAAIVLGISEASVRSRVKRARDRLKQYREAAVSRHIPTGNPVVEES